MKVQPVIFLSVIVTTIVLVSCGKKRNNGSKKEQSLVDHTQEHHISDKFYRQNDRSLKWRLKTNYFKKPKKVKKTKKVFHSSEQDSFDYDNLSVEPKLRKDRRPNIILFLTDDQDVELGSLQYMPKVEQILKNSGAFFPNAYVSTPMCCPSRSSLLTGLYVHNHKVLTNSDNCSSTYWQTEHEPRTFGAYLATAGYRTGYFGKYLNKYNGSYVPPGWRNWAGLVMNSKYYNYTINRNGQKIKHGGDYHKDYYPDLVTNDSIRFIHEWKENYSASPMLLVMSFPAPHGPEDSAPQYSDMYFNVTSHRTPAYDFAPNPDKQWILRWVNKMEPVHHQFTDLLMTKRLQTLQTVDDAVERVYKELKAMGELDNTYIFYTSDHGYHLGQFGLVKGKSFPFEFDIRVPFLVRGPGIKPGTTVLNIVANVDLAPTFLDIAGIPQPSHMDGNSFLRFLRKKSELSNPHDQKRWRDTILLERGKPPPSELAPLNTVEDIPISTPQPVTTKATESPDRGLRDSEGAEGDDGDDIVREYPAKPPKFEMLAIECQKEQYQSPCEPFQKWECLQVGDHWKMRRCPMPTIYGLEGRCNCKKKKVSQRKRINEEKKMQREFLREYVNRDINQYKPRFLKMKRSKRGLFDDDPFFAALEDKPISDIVAEGELDEVDLILEGINEEISSLEAYNGTAKATTPAVSVFDSCTMISGGNVTCRSEVYEDVKQWRQSKENIERQILLLKKQLEEMQMIRRHLKRIRPTPNRNNPPPSKPQINDTSAEEGYEEYVIDPMAPVEVPSVDDDSSDFDSDAEGDDDDNGPDTVESDNGTVTYDIAMHNSSSVDSHDTWDGLNKKHDIDGDGIYEPEENQNVTQEKGEDCLCDNRLYKRWRKKQEELRRQEQKRRLREQRLKKKQKKLRRKLAREQAGCNLDKMNCFNHDNSHWRTEPLWQGGQFCVCMNANNNTYWCLRTINATHNFLYCEFITGFVTFYDMKIDQYQLRNIAHTLSEDQLNFLHSVLVKYRICKGEECNVNIGTVWRKEMAARKKQKSKKGLGYEETQDFPVPNENSTASSADPKPGKKKQLGHWGRHRRKEVDVDEEI